ncbi:MAG: translocation/assembly module TamB domain-containing protein [Verrucomicrobiota bacterium]
MRRRLFSILAALLAAVVLAVVTLPFWLGAATKAAVRSRGITFSSYERIGYARFALRDVVVVQGNVRVTATRVEAPTPVLWGWRHTTNGSNPIMVEKWEVEVTKSTTPPKPSTTEKGWVPLRVLLNKIAFQLDRWLSEATVGAGRVKFPGGEIALDSGTWSERTLKTKGLRYREIVADATVDFSRTEDVFRVDARTTDGITKTALESRGGRVNGSLEWSGQRATIEGAFPSRGWLPTEMILNAPDWTVPAAKLKLEQAYAVVRGTARIEWREDNVAVIVSATSEPLEGQKAPPLKIDLRGQGDTQAFTVEALQADIPGVNAKLDAPVVVERSGKLRDAGARLTVQADLAKQPWFKATGAVTGEARVVSGEDAKPVVEFALSAKGVTARDVNLAEVGAQGRLAWPRLEIASGTIVAGEGERLEVRGGWDFKAKALSETTVEGKIRRQSLARWLPKQPEFDVVTISARASGALAEIAHSGKVQADRVVFNGVNPLAVAASWQGRGVGAESFEAEVTAGGSKIAAKGSATSESLQLNALDVKLAQDASLALTAPALFRWRPSVRLEPLKLAGPKGNLSVSFIAGEVGKVELAAANISSTWFSDFVPPKGPVWQVTLLALMGTWDRGPMNFSLTAGAALDIGEGRMATVSASARGDKGGVRIEALRATESDATVVNATGRLPVTISPGAAEKLAIDENGELVLDATASPNAAFWQKLAAVSGVELKEPDAVANVRGTWLKPEGSVSLKAARVAFDPKKFTKPLPTIEEIDVRVKGDRNGVALDNFTLKVEGQAVKASGRLPVPDGRWADLFKEPLAMARSGADLQIDVPEAEVAVFARFMPAVLAPQGRIAASVTYKNGEMGGFVRLRDAASRPLGPLGVLQEVTADIEMTGRKLVLRGVTARSGGQPVTLSGTIELPPEATATTAGANQPAQPVQPRFDLTLKGENLPFVRQTGLLLRGDIDLKLETPATGTARISGMVRLRDSLFLSDVRSFLPKGGGVSAARRPPYFSVDTPPMNAWRLAVAVEGDRFVKLRTPVFTGVGSAHFRLGGTLGEPRAIGEVVIDEGAVTMPFARFAVKQASVRLTEADPYEPAIYLRGTGRRLGFDLAMEIDGKASAPNVTFTSSPALDSEQLLLMVMTGAAPRNDISVTTSQRATQLGAFFGQNLISSFTGDSADEDRLSIIAGEKVSRQGKETYEVEYKLSERWTATAEINEFDDKIAGLKWRMFRGESAKSKEKEKAEEQKKQKEKAPNNEK